MLSWDQEAQDLAYQQALQVKRRDPDAAALLFAQINAERRAFQEQRRETPENAVEAAVPPGVYDPIDLYCRLAREFHWRDVDMDRMDYVRFFAYVDRLGKQQQREKQEHPGSGNAGALPQDVVDAENQRIIAGLAPQPQTYTGEVVTYGGR